MRVREALRSHGGKGHGGMENSWHLGYPMWREKDLEVLMEDSIAGWQIARRLMGAIREPFMGPSDGGPSLKLSKVGALWGNIPPAALCLNHSANRSDHPPP